MATNLEDKTEPKTLALVVLDQNAISNLAVWAVSKPEWMECRCLLEKGVRNGRLLCPGPPESFAETAPIRNVEHRLRIKTLISELSRGWFFKFPWEILAEEGLSIARPGFKSESLRFHHYTPHAGPEDDEQAKVQTLEANLIEAYINDIPLIKLPRGHTTVEACAYKWAVAWLRCIRSNLNRLRNGHTVWDDNFIVTQMCATLINHGITDDEIRQMLADIKHGQWLKIPYFQCLYMMEGLALYETFYHERRYSHNFYWDVWRAAAAYHCGDVFVSDGALISHMEQLGLKENHLSLCKVNDPVKFRSILLDIVDL